jgi:hypothetical protein
MVISAFVFLICCLSGPKGVLSLPSSTSNLPLDSLKDGSVDQVLEVVKSHLSHHWTSTEMPRILEHSNLCPAKAYHDDSEHQKCLDSWSKDWKIYLDENVLSPLLADFKPLLVSELSSTPSSSLSKRSTPLSRDKTQKLTRDLALSKGHGLRRKLKGLLQSFAKKWRGSKGAIIDTEALMNDKIV